MACGRSQIYVVLVDGLVGAGTEPLEQLRDDCGLVLRVTPRPRPRFHFEEKALGGRMHQTIDVNVELCAAITDEPAPPIFLYLSLTPRFEVFAIKARRVRSRGEEPRAEQ